MDNKINTNPSTAKPIKNNGYPMRNNSYIVYFFAGLSTILAVIIIIFLLISNSSQPHLITPTISSAEKNTSGIHCAHDSLIINIGHIECESAEHISSALLTEQNPHDKEISGFSCTISHNKNTEYHFYDYWCENSENSFFGSFRSNYYAQFPAGLAHWIKDSHIFLRDKRPGIDFRTKGDTVQCIIYKTTVELLLCSRASFPQNSSDSSTQMPPNNLVILHPNGNPTLTFGQVSEFSYGKNAILEPQTTIYYLGYICTDSNDAMTCYSSASGGKGFTVSPTIWNPHN